MLTTPCANIIIKKNYLNTADPLFTPTIQIRLRDVLMFIFISMFLDKALLFTSLKVAELVREFPSGNICCGIYCFG